MRSGASAVCVSKSADYSNRTSGVASVGDRARAAAAGAPRALRTLTTTYYFMLTIYTK